MQALLHFDSSISDRIHVRIPGQTNVEVKVTYINFTLDSGEGYQDLSAYLWINCNIVSLTTSTNQPNKTKDGFVIPIAHPNTKPEIRSCVKGHVQTEDELRFIILDKDCSPVETSRLVVTLEVNELK